MSIRAHYFNGVNRSVVVQPSGSYPVMPNLNVPFGQAGIYKIDGYNVDCRVPGLYRFKLPGRAYWLNRIIGKSVAGVTDLYALMSAISWNQVYGEMHELSPDPVSMTDSQCQAISNSGHYGKWRMRCGYVVRFLLWLLPQYGVSSRRIQLNTGLAFNGDTDGHVAIETYANGRWSLWDISNGLYFTDGNGLHLNTREVMELLRAGTDPTVVQIDATHKWSSDAIDFYDMSVLCDAEVLTPDELMVWHKRVMQIPEINAVAWLPPGTESKASWLAGRGVQVVTEQAFNSMFYP
ncbi:hypothetical protein [Pseudomonas extremaustralis]|uniref:hypothetical protein n=1 Tax=Pseudomonas extremaustralis TaxID=359110 RepID=UPI00230704BC|nr:hypothetical protein [Pseudomonas extremaustralis]MDB1108059.1 hypothetical protein [Pseudomonas extremaustralis]